jgi:cold shock CspA family protein
LIIVIDLRFGIVKFFSERGFGFITLDDGSDDVFVHISAVKKSGLDELNVGDRISFTVVAGRNGPMATDIRLAA